MKIMKFKKNNFETALLGQILCQFFPTSVEKSESFFFMPSSGSFVYICVF